ncbi:bacterial transcriptional activator domain-containing protein [Clostridium oryzae]|uniref:Transcriptional regulatory protein MoaR1 n=1 Tax=Clostridium oryzae TaxID=1450648 RepID=A0A1V4IW04_9CLOT|nr:BTAD domain-containing putative transcriptional regulator [Clostridium oryzae]OPJ63975.1 transcriptional regulatory protein MoaR1 [Clostridium oryzae]
MGKYEVFDDKGILTERNANNPDNFDARICCFGSFQVYNNIDTYPLKWRTSKSKEMFAYFFQNRNKHVYKWKICQALWPEMEDDKVNVHLHTTIYKMKKTLSLANIKVNVKYINGYYIMNLPHYYSDIEEFEKILDSGIEITEDNIQGYKSVVDIYTDNYMEENNYIWSLSTKEIYLRKFTELCLSLIKFYVKRGFYNDAINLNKKLLKSIPLDENAHEILLDLYARKQDRTSFVNHYNHLRTLLKNELDIEPNESITSLYLMIINEKINA